MKYLVILIVGFFLVSCSDKAISDYKSPYINQKFKNLEVLAYLQNLPLIDNSIFYDVVYKAPFSLSELRASVMANTDGLPGSTQVRVALVKKGTKFEVIDSFAVETSWFKKIARDAPSIKYLLLRDEFGNISEIEESLIKKILESKSEDSSKSEFEKEIFADLDYLEKNKHLNTVYCSLENSSKDFLVAGKNEQKYMYGNYPEQGFNKFKRKFSFVNDIELLDLFWMKKNADWFPCIALKFKNEEAYMTVLRYGDNWGIPVDGRFFLESDKYGILKHQKNSSESPGVIEFAHYENEQTKDKINDNSYKREKIPL